MPASWPSVGSSSERPTSRMIFYLATADTELLTLSHALDDLPPGFEAVRAANPASLSPEAGEALLAEVEASATLVIVRLLGGKRSFPPGFDRLERACRAR